MEETNLPPTPLLSFSFSHGRHGKGHPAEFLLLLRWIVEEEEEEEEEDR